jgi:TrmH family RNA methyltransferase
MSHERITSPTNPRVKALVRLRKRSERTETERFLIEGFREVTRAVDAGIDLPELYFCPEMFLGGTETALLERSAAAGSRLVELAPAAFRKVTYRDRPEGLLAVGKPFPTGLDALDLPADPLVLVVESIEKPGNLGTMLRTADAAGADAVIVCDPTTDPFNPNVVRASLGCLFIVPLAVTSTASTMSFCRNRSIVTYAATPSAGTLHWEVDYRGAAALVVGSEQFGLTEAWLSGADRRIRIPMYGSADSLNAAMAAGVLLYEAVRRRRGLNGQAGAREPGI